MNTVKDTISTTFERDLLLTFLDQFDQIIFNSNIDVKSFIGEKVDAKYKDILMVCLGQGAGGPEALFSQSKVLRQELRSMSVVGITTTFQPDEDTAIRIGKKIREIIGISVLINFVTDPDLIGGAIIEGNGRVGEYSFRKYFEKRINQRRVQNGL